MLIGYARTSTVDQAAGFEAQIVELEAYGCERTYQEQVSEPPLVCRRLITSSHATISNALNCA